MTLRLSAVKWLRVLATAVLIYVVSFLLIFVVILGYATFLGFQARGAPDPALITAFANQAAPIGGRLGLVVLTFGAAAWLGRRLATAGPLNGLILGIIVGLPNLISRSPSVGAILTTALAVLAGWLGGTLGGRSQ
jgi:hypothetical protein